MKISVLLTFLLFALSLQAQLVESDSISHGSKLNKGIFPSDHHASVHDDVKNKFVKSKHLTGDWGGAREVWINNGVDPFLFYVSIAASNVSGGLDQAIAYGGQVYAGIKFDFDKAFGWKGTRFKLSMANRHGNGLMADVGSIYNPTTVVGIQNTYFYDFSVEKDLGEKFALKLGRVTAADDFSSSTLYKYSLSNSINGPIRPLLLDRLMSSFPAAIWGTRLKYRPSSKHLFQLGAYQISVSMFDPTNHGFDFSFRSSDDLSLFFQYDWFGKVADRTARVYLGAHQAFGTLTHLDAENESNYFVRVYGHVDVELIEGLRSFLTMSYSNQDEIARVPFQISLGLIWKGVIQPRPDDSVLFFASHGSFGDDFSALQVNNLSSEMILELGYRYYIIDYVALNPSIQYDIKPGGSGVIDNAVILGLGLLAVF